jgi:hypothetical protein
LHTPEQQSDPTVQDAPLRTQVAPQAVQPGVPSLLLQRHVPSAQQVCPSKQSGIPLVPGSSAGSQHEVPPATGMISGDVSRLVSAVPRSSTTGQVGGSATKAPDTVKVKTRERTMLGTTHLLGADKPVRPI